MINLNLEFRHEYVCVQFSLCLGRTSADMSWGRPPVRVLYRGARRPCSARRVRLDRDLAAWRTLTQQRAQLAAAAEATGEALEAQV